jgi:hypothetical protein
VRLVCPHEPALIDRLDGRTVCVRVDGSVDIAGAAADVRRRNSLTCVICQSVPIEEIDVEEDWRGVPIALMAPAVGRFRNVAKKVEALRKLNLRVYLPGNADNLTGARLLASLGIPVCIDFEAVSDWDAVVDLMTYALLGMMPHAPIDPFQTIADGYKQSARCDDWGRIFFDDPSHYLHLDAEGRIALSRRELLAGDFVAGDLSELDSPKIKEEINTRCGAWRNLFAEDHFCARCRVWRICRARLRDGKAAPDGCDAFFLELAEVIERRRSKPGSNGAVEQWRP